MEIRTVQAPNPGLMTGPGTNTYVVVSRGRALVIDPGPPIDSHLAAVREALVGLDPVGVAVTHGHPDHAPAAAPLAEALGVPVHAYGPVQENGALADGDRVRVGDEEVEALYTPGHSIDHLCFRIGTVVFAGDLVMGGSTVVIEDLDSYLASLRRVIDLDPDTVYPGHGPPITEPRPALAAVVEHRLERERQILAALEAGDRTLADIVARVYADVDGRLHPLAGSSVAAHLRKLAGEGRVRFAGPQDGWDIAVVPIRGAP